MIPLTYKEVLCIYKLMWSLLNSHVLTVPCFLLPIPVFNANIFPLCYFSPLIVSFVYPSSYVYDTAEDASVLRPHVTCAYCTINKGVDMQGWA